MFTPDQWSLAATAPGEAAGPAELQSLALRWIPASVPGTVAEALAAAGEWDFDRPRDFDASDWWYRSRFTVAAAVERIRFDGLATLAQVWLDGRLVLETDNMFRRYTAGVELAAGSSHELLIRFRSLNAALAERRPRPRWKTKLVEQQQLRWFRTTLLGRIPGWTPPVAPVGPWRPIIFEERDDRVAADIDLRTHVEDRAGVVEFSCRVHAPEDAAVRGELAVGEASTALAVEREDDRFRLTGRLRVEPVALWWPHTHGEPALYDCTLSLAIGGRTSTVDCGRIGFRTLDVQTAGGDFELRVNGQPVFCRGTCWTPLDVVSLRASDDAYEDALRLLRDAGANTVRIGGTMVYEEEAFYRACDALGILVWQDFLFANMDYPAADHTFAGSVTAEATELLQRLQRHPAVAVHCGNSEVEQQAAMLGMPPELWRNALFGELLPELCARWHSGTAYVPSTPSAPPDDRDALPFQTATGITHYYGVGAYLRPIADARRANVRFTPECLGFANVPAQELVDALLHGSASTHDPRWKSRTPRDSGAGWDFEDVRDHYLRELFGVDPVQLRSFDPRRYLDLSRVVTGEVMAQVYAEWRSTYSHCRGALMWFLRDLWPGAGWGIIDSRGVPKACFYALRRSWQPRAVVLTDEGLDGVHVHVLNETSEPLHGTIEVMLLRDGHVVVAQASSGCEVPPRGAATFGADALLGAFYDTAYAYRFGPPKHDVLIATLSARDGVIGEAFHFPLAAEPKRAAAATVIAEMRPASDGVWETTVRSDRFLYAAHLDVPGLIPDDDFFHLVPAREKRVTLRGRSGEAIRPRGFLEAVNLDEPVRITIIDA